VHQRQQQQQFVVIEQLNIAIGIHVDVGDPVGACVQRRFDHQSSARRDAVHERHFVRPAGELEPA
jgi:hypothetical protein